MSGGNMGPFGRGWQWLTTDSRPRSPGDTWAGIGLACGGLLWLFDLVMFVAFLASGPGQTLGLLMLGPIVAAPLALFAFVATGGALWREPGQRLAKASLAAAGSGVALYFIVLAVELSL